MECLHCGNKMPYKYEGYCEKCFQDLINENMRLQMEIMDLKRLQAYKPKHLKEQCNYYDFSDELSKHITTIDFNIKE